MTRTRAGKGGHGERNPRRAYPEVEVYAGRDRRVVRRCEKQQRKPERVNRCKSNRKNGDAIPVRAKKRSIMICHAKCKCETPGPVFNVAIRVDFTARKIPSFISRRPPSPQRVLNNIELGGQGGERPLPTPVLRSFFSLEPVISNICHI